MTSKQGLGESMPVPEKRSFAQKNWRALVNIFGVVAVAASLNACTPGTESGSVAGGSTTIEQNTRNHTATVPQSIVERQRNNPHDKKFEVSHEARDRALEAVKNERKVAKGGSFYVQL